eukprot:m.7923 g.7923  ORF g.7923 m.7923 type:complete len:80 (+) comp20034_c0_seq1:6246-6485(+)
MSMRMTLKSFWLPFKEKPSSIPPALNLEKFSEDNMRKLCIGLNFDCHYLCRYSYIEGRECLRYFHLGFGRRGITIIVYA